MTAPPSKKPRVVRGSERVRESARVAGWAVGLSGLVSLVGALLAQHRAGSLAVQTFAAEWGAGQLGVAWSDPEAPVPSNALLARRVARGAGLGLLAAGTSLVFASLTGAATFGRPRATPYELLAGLAIATFLAMRDELILRGLTLRIFRHTLPPLARLLVCGAVAAAAHVAQLPDASLASFVTTAAGGCSLAIAAMSGVCFGALWLHERGAWTACGAHVAWGLTTPSAISGGLWDARSATSVWGGAGGAVQGVDASGAITVALVLITGAVLFATRSTWYRADARTR